MLRRKDQNKLLILIYLIISNIILLYSLFSTNFEMKEKLNLQKKLSIQHYLKSFITKDQISVGNKPFLSIEKSKLHDL